jgi:hypothetical protein
MLRACFWLLAAVIIAEMLLTAVSATACVWLIVAGRSEIGACSDLGVRAREIFAELLAAVLALLLAGTTQRHVGGERRETSLQSAPSTNKDIAT